MQPILKIKRFKIINVNCRNYDDILLYESRKEIPILRLAAHAAVDMSHSQHDDCFCFGNAVRVWTDGNIRKGTIHVRHDDHEKSRSD